MFISTAKLPGNFASPSGKAGNVADATCQGYADAASLGGHWKAWLSDTSTSPGVRFERSTVPYVQTDGTTVAANWSGLTSGAALSHAIDRSETGALITNAGVWTATDYAGNPVISGMVGTMYPIGDCTDFTTNAAGPPYPAIGLSGATDSTWSYVYLSGCDTLNRLYCFEQP